MYFVIFVPCYLCLLYGSEINLKVKVKSKRRWGSSLPGLRTPDPPLSPPSTLPELPGSDLKVSVLVLGWGGVFQLIMWSLPT